MEAVKENRETPGTFSSKNPIIKMMEDQKRIVTAIEKGEGITQLRGIKIVSPI